MNDKLIRQGDLIRFCFVLDPDDFGIVLKTYQEVKGHGANQRLMTSFQVLTSSGLLFINDIEWKITRENLII